MGLDDFEKELAAQSKTKESRRSEKERHHRPKDKDRKHDRHHHTSRHHSSRDDRDREDRRSHKRPRHHDDETPEERDRRKRRECERRDRSRSREKEEKKKKYQSGLGFDVSEDDEERISRRRKPRGDEEEESSDTSPDEAEYFEKDIAPPEEETLDEMLEEAANANLERDSWMQAPSSLDVDYVQRQKKEEKSQWKKATIQDFQMQEEDEPPVKDEPAQREVNYTFGDAGSQWRMTKLKAVYKTAEETGRPAEEIALERYGDLRDFDDAREEEIEVDRRKMYGKDYVGKEKPSGELFQERKLDHGIRRTSGEEEDIELPQGEIVNNPRPSTNTVKMDQTALNKLKAQMMKAKLKGAANAAQLETEYNAAMAEFANRKEPDVVVLGAMDNRMLAGGRKGEVTSIDNKRGRERGLVKENEEMSIEDMVRQERRTKGQAGGEGLLLAERIAKDAKFENDLDYMDESATKLAARAPKSEINLRNMAISDFQKMNRVLDSCPLCHHEDKSPPQPPIAPIVSLATRVYLTLPTEPEISEGGAVIVPIQHRTNLLECDDDEWEEIRNFMKALTRLYHDQGRDVLFYENAAAPQRKLHAAMMAVPIPFELGETAPAFFREAILASDEEWTQHKKLIDTLKASRSGLGRQAFRKSLAKEMPYFHVWFELNGGMGHVVEDSNRWPRGDLFAREILGGMMDVDVGVVKRQGRWQKGDRRVEGFRKRWRKFDWTRELTDA